MKIIFVTLAAVALTLVFTSAISAPKEYRVIKSYSSENLAGEVTQQLAAGWTLQGGVSASYEGPNAHYAQAMTR